MGRKRKLDFENGTSSKFTKLSTLWGNSKETITVQAADAIQDEIRAADHDIHMQDDDSTSEKQIHIIASTDAKSLSTPSKPCTPGYKGVHVATPASSTKKENRKFREEWKHGRPWLSYNLTTKGMFCSICTRAQVKNNFTSDTGCTILKSNSLTKHENAKGENSHEVAKELVSSSQQFENAQKKLIEKSEASVVAAMKNIYFMAKFNLPNSLFGDLNTHCIDQGCDDLLGLKVDYHTTYEHSDSVLDFQEAISSVIMENNIKCISDKPYSVMIDESTDISVDQNLLIYCRYLNKNLGRFEPKSVLLGVRKLKNGANAEKVTNEVFDCLDECNLDKNNMCGISTDGAAVMVGRHSGVVTRMKDIIPGLLSTHCISHRLALASGAAADSVPYLIKYQEIINAIYKYFGNSPKNMSRLEKIYDVMKSSESHATRFKQVFHTRWLSFEGSVKAICQNYDSLICVLSEDKGAKAQGLLKSVSNFKFMYCSFFLSDILKDLSILCKSYQSSTIVFTDVNPLLEVTVQNIKKHFENEDGTMFRQFCNEVPNECTSDNFQFKGHTIKDSVKYRSEAKSACSKFIEQLVQNMKNRFSFAGDSIVLSSMCNVFDPTIFGSECKDRFVESVNNVTVHFADCNIPDFEESEMKEQFFTFSDIVKSSYSHCSNSVNDVCQIALKHSDTYPYVYRTAVKLLTVPVSSVECERGFSRQNLIKTKLRNRLNTSTLKSLMIISLEGPLANLFNFTEAFRHWSSKKKRRICSVLKK